MHYIDSRETWMKLKSCDIFLLYATMLGVIKGSPQVRKLIGWDGSVQGHAGVGGCHHTK